MTATVAERSVTRSAGFVEYIPGMLFGFAIALGLGSAASDFWNANVTANPDLLTQGFLKLLIVAVIAGAGISQTRD